MTLLRFVQHYVTGTNKDLSQTIRKQILKSIDKNTFSNRISKENKSSSKLQFQYEWNILFKLVN